MGPKKKIAPKPKQPKVEEQDIPVPINNNVPEKEVPKGPVAKKKPVYVPKTRSVWVMKKKPVPAIPPSQPPASILMEEVQDEATLKETKPQSPIKRPGIFNRSRLSSSNRGIKSKAGKGKVEAWRSLQDAAMGMKPLSVFESGDKHPAQELLFKHRNLELDQLEGYRRNYIKQRNALDYWDEVQDDREKLENVLVNKSGRARGKTINRRDLNLPKSEPDGLEINQWTEERTETPDVFPVWTFFQVPEVRSNGLTSYISKKDRGYNVLKDVVGCPDTTKYCFEDLFIDTCKLNSKADHKAKHHSNSKHLDHGDGKIIINSSFQPVINELFVVGKNYDHTHKCIKEKHLRKRTLSTKILFETSELPECGSRVSLKYYRRGTPSIIQQNEWTREKYSSTACVKFGPHVLYFSRLPNQHNKEFIVECGSTSEVGKTSISHVYLVNLGTTAVHFSWSKVIRGDNLSTHRYINDRFVFDNWGGTVLPSQTYKIPILYKSYEAGYYSEDWKLLTQPQMENGAPVILRIWGLSKEYDPHFAARERIDEALKKKIPWNIVGLQVRKIIDYLPLTDTNELKDIRFRLETVGPDLFAHHNPALKYNTASVYRLGKLLALLKHRELKYRRVSSGKSSIDGGDNDFTPNSKSTLVSMTDADEISRFSSSDSLVEGEFETEVKPSTQVLSDSQSRGLNSPRDRAMSKYADSLLSACTRISSTPFQYVSSLINPDVPRVADPQPEFSRTVSAKYSIEEVTPKSESSAAKSEVLESSFSISMQKESSTRTASSNNKKNNNKTNVRQMINLVDPNFSVDEIRKMILKESGALVVQEAFFTIMVQEVDKLCFRPSLAKEDWKRTVFFNMFAEAMDTFATYATRLKAVYLEAEEKKRLKEVQPARSRPNNQLSEVQTIYTEHTVSTEDEESQKTSTVQSNSLLTDPRSARQAGMKTSAENTQIKPDTQCQAAIRLRLHEAMYQLLTDLLDKFPPLFATEREPPLRLDYKEAPFTKVKEVKMPIDLFDQLEAPLPPHWMAQATQLMMTQMDNQNRLASSCAR